MFGYSQIDGVDGNALGWNKRCAQETLKSAWGGSNFSIGAEVSIIDSEMSYLRIEIISYTYTPIKVIVSAKVVLLGFCCVKVGVVQ